MLLLVFFLYVSPLIQEPSSDVKPKGGESRVLDPLLTCETSGLQKTSSQVAFDASSLDYYDLDYCEPTQTGSMVKPSSGMESIYEHEMETIIQLQQSRGSIKGRQKGNRVFQFIVHR